MRLQFSVLYHRSGSAQLREAIEATLSRLGDAIANLAEHVTESGKLRTIRLPQPEKGA
jgi:hypothetical protein